MFGSEEEYKIPLTNSMRVAIVSHNIQNIELATKIQENVLIGYKKNCNSLMLITLMIYLNIEN